MTVLSIILTTPPAKASEVAAIELGNGQLTVEQVVDVARRQIPVSVSPGAMDRVDRGFKVVMEAAVQNVPIYGLTVGVGQNKDKSIFKEVNGQRVLSEETMQASRRFNLDALRSHAAAVGEPLPPEVVRAGMLIRLNSILTGACGAQRDIAQRYVDFLNKNIVPVVPSTGTIGEADITLASHIGLVMVGEWEAFYGGRRISGADALKAAGLQPLRPVGKDFLCIISNNGLMVGDAALGVYDVNQYLHHEATAFALSLEGLNGNVAPFLEATTRVRPFPGVAEAAKLIRDALAGSSLWVKSSDRLLQDPLSFRDMAYTLGNALSATEEAERIIEIEVNHTEDNPMVVPDVTETERPGSSQVNGYLVHGKTNGAIYPTANFEPLPVVSAVERVSLALGTISESLTMSIMRLGEPEHTHLPRFLTAPDNPGHAFGAIQKTFVAIDAENRALAMPVSLDTVPVAGSVEDRSTDSRLTVDDMRKLVANLYELSSFQLLFSTQAVDLRKDFVLGEGTRKLYNAYRRVVPFVDQDRVFTRDLQQGVELVRSWPINNDERTNRANSAPNLGGGNSAVPGPSSGAEDTGEP
jgi:histidine ammonia-lyase